MASADPWPIIHAERGALADDLAGLTAAQWTTSSLCEGWSVHDMLGHIVATAKTTPARFFGKFAGSGFNFDKMAARDAADETAGGPHNTLAAYRGLQTATKHPPGPVDAMVGEAIIHAEDIRRPLGLAHTYDPAGVVRVLDFYKKSNLIVGAKKRIAGLTLRASDADWSTGSGPEVTGPAMSLLLAMTGRKAAHPDLSGEGLTTLQQRN
jgi:uncharacterized protein (TIGR03083 family)